MTDATRLCVTNAKGGTGKTTVAINVAGALNERGRDVLLVDLDPQGNATEGLGLVDAYEREPPTLFDALVDPASRDAVPDLIVEHEEMDVLPSNVDMLQAERELAIADFLAQVRESSAVDVDPRDLAPLVRDAAVDGSTPGTAALDEALATVDSEYDYVVVDSPPFYGQLTDAGIYATRNVIVPALTEATSERAVELLFDQIAALERRVDVSVEEVGVVANRVETTNEDREMIEWLERVFADVPVWEVRKRVALQRAFSAGGSVFAYDGSIDVADAFLEIGATLDERFGYAEVTP